MGESSSGHWSSYNSHRLLSAMLRTVGPVTAELSYSKQRHDIYGGCLMLNHSEFQFNNWLNSVYGVNLKTIFLRWIFFIVCTKFWSFEGRGISLDHCFSFESSCSGVCRFRILYWSLFKGCAFNFRWRDACPTLMERKRFSIAFLSTIRECGNEN